MTLDIHFFLKKVMYQIELSVNKTGKCKKTELTEPFHKFAIPTDATFAGEGTSGSNAIPGAGVNVQLFTGEIQGG